MIYVLVAVALNLKGVAVPEINSIQNLDGINEETFKKKPIISS